MVWEKLRFSIFLILIFRLKSHLKFLRRKPSRQKRQFQLLFARMTLKEKNFGRNVVVAVDAAVVDVVVVVVLLATDIKTTYLERFFGKGAFPLLFSEILYLRFRLQLIEKRLFMR